ncbi:hypothetical protein Tco_1330878, partial [Tanacetum coccineum]
HLSDHRPILLREVVTDYGPSPFRVYHSWFSLQGFDQMVLETWNNIDLDDKNKMVRFKKKLQILKKEIRSWVNIKYVPAGSTSNVPADCVSAGHVHIPADSDIIC